MSIGVPTSGMNWLIGGFANGYERPGEADVGGIRDVPCAGGNIGISIAAGFP